MLNQRFYPVHWMGSTQYIGYRTFGNSNLVHWISATKKPMGPLFICPIPVPSLPDAKLTRDRMRGDRPKYKRGFPVDFIMYHTIAGDLWFQSWKPKSAYLLYLNQGHTVSMCMYNFLRQPQDRDIYGNVSCFGFDSYSIFASHIVPPLWGTQNLMLHL